MRPQLGVRNVTREAKIRRAGRLVENAALPRSPQLVAPTDTGVNRRTAHEPAIPGHGRVIQQIVLDDVVELLRGVLGRDALHEPDPQIFIVLFWRLPGIGLKVAAAHFAAIPDRGPLGREKARAGLEPVVEVMVETEHDRLKIRDPRLVASRIARHVERGSRTVGSHHQRNNPIRHRTSPASGNDVALERVANRNSVHLAKAGWIVDLSLRDGTPQSVRAGLASGEQCAEIPLLKSVDRSRVAETGKHAGTELQVIEIREKERLVPAVVYLGNVHRATDGKPIGVITYL